MKLLSKSLLPSALSKFHTVFPRQRIRALWSEIEPRHYEREIEAANLIQSFLMAFTLHLSGLREIVRCCSRVLRTENYSSLSPALARPTSLATAQKMLDEVGAYAPPNAAELISLDSMAVTLAKTQRHHCEKFNDKTVGGGVLWGYVIDWYRGGSPVQILTMIRGAWHDSKLIKTFRLIANGPTYLMDRGFYSIANVARWIDEHVWFIVRARRRELHYELVRTVGAARTVAFAKDNKRYKKTKKRRTKAKSKSQTLIRIIEDSIVRLGSPKRKQRPGVRLVYAILPDGKDLILVSNHLSWSAQSILKAYKKRWQIELLHQFFKQTVGLAHLNSFHQNGIEFLLHVAVLLAILLLLGRDKCRKTTLEVLYVALADLRLSLDVRPVWKPNTVSPRHAKRKRTSDLCAEEFA